LLNAPAGLTTTGSCRTDTASLSEVVNVPADWVRYLVLWWGNILRTRLVCLQLC